MSHIGIDSSALHQSLFLCRYFTSNFYDFLFSVNFLEDLTLNETFFQPLDQYIIMLGADQTDGDSE